jgi:hypothetical protein
MTKPIAPLFQLDDVLTFRLSDGGYRAAICAQISALNRNGPATPKSGTRRTYDLVPTNFRGDTPPTLGELRRCSIAGHKIDTSFDASKVLAMQPGVDALWKLACVAGDCHPFFFGLDYLLVAHKEALTFADLFTTIGTLSLKSAFKRQGGYRYISSFDQLERAFLINERETFHRGNFPLDILCS